MMERSATTTSIRRFYDRWPQYNRRLLETVAGLTNEQLALRAAPDHWPIWAIVAHAAGTRVYWLCHVLGEPGADTTPFTDPGGDGWEDDLEHARSRAELVAALESTFAIVDGVLDRWTPEMLEVGFERRYGEERQVHTRTSVLQRLLTHEAYHDGEIAIALGSHGVEPVYIWRPYTPDA
jgi:uncharacterized damage-inducible protein DinB